MNDFLTSAPAFRDRREAGQALAKVLRAQVGPGEPPVILALPRGGVPVAYEIALQLHAPLDLLLVRKIGAPGHEEFAIGAVADGAHPHWIIDQDMLKQFNVPAQWFDAQKDRQLREIERRRALYCGDNPPISIAGRDVIVVDDGVATGNTAKVALMTLADAHPKRLRFATPVGAREALDALRPQVDEVICLATPEPFRAVGFHYEQFDQTSDEEVIDLLGKARQRFAG